MTSAPLILTEGAPGIPVTLSSAEYRALTDLGIITVTPTLTDGIYEVMAGRKVGGRGHR